ncbi:hypothetical protein TTHERM_00554550 (macronuclear) [Tetrahymena thermophila SB210]|uniref:Uncharacterized protein n=1 Tax=Tetrahymena thermophila (strain SB210) TaxID=312017 RepID=Q22UH0_TETTS|nr:hypothetical protein TTHERM_00554550 [Tetrahymena thermophila SB210]EAR89000.1 hypothetical protein TTHERM_00554550 [Tetrahymena thermophila SB210]|eukprot:XP_001009245.1 hypothetical protein TTHERM_00554550 [Tetrahymena thermophila SB210]
MDNGDQAALLINLLLYEALNPNGVGPYYKFSIDQNEVYYQIQIQYPTYLEINISLGKKHACSYNHIRILWQKYLLPIKQQIKICNIKYNEPAECIKIIGTTQICVDDNYYLATGKIEQSNLIENERFTKKLTQFKSKTTENQSDYKEEQHLILIKLNLN